MRIFGKLSVALLLMAAPTSILAAQDVAAPSPVSLSGDVMAVKVTTDEAGVETSELVQPDLIVPGDRLIFGTDYANNGAEPVTAFVVTNPLPAAVRLAPDADPALSVSVDGGASWGLLADLTVTEADGTSRAATQADVTHVRWTLASIAPGEAGRLEYPAIIR